MENKKNNSATRVHALLLKARSSQDKEITQNVWKAVLTQSNEQMETYEVVRLVDLLRKEIKSVERGLVKAGVPKPLYSSYLDSALNATSIVSMNSGWANYKKYITNELLLCLRFSEFILEDHEPEFEDESIEEVIKLISELKESLKESDVDPDLFHFVSEQINLLERGLHDVKIRGSKAIQKCYVDGLGEIIEHSELIEENHDKPVVKKLKQAWGHIHSATEKAAKINKAVDTWTKLLGKTSEIIEHFPPLN